MRFCHLENKLKSTFIAASKHVNLVFTQSKPTVPNRGGIPPQGGISPF